MKKRVLLYFAMAVLMAMPQQMMADDIAINETNFPDENFRNWVLAQDYGQDGVLTEEEIAGVRSIEVSSMNIASMKGLEYFTALTYLSCSGNQLTELDVSNNTLVWLIYCNYNQLILLDVSKNTALTNLRCCDNQLNSIDVSQNTALTELICDNNQLTSLDVSKNLQLNLLNCNNNQLTSLDVSQNTALNYLYCHTNQLTSLDILQNTALKQLECSNNLLTSLDVSMNTAMVRLSCSANYLASLDVSQNTALISLSCYENQINETEMGNLVESLSANNGGLSVKNLSSANEQNVITTAQVAAARAKGWTVYARVDGGNWIEYDGDGSTFIPINSTTFPDENFRNWVLAQDYGQDGVLTEEEIARVMEIYVSWNNITSLKGIEYFTALARLSCGGNQLTSLDVSQNIALTYLDCVFNQLTSLDVSKNMVLTHLSCDWNQLTSLDVSKNTSLTWLTCEGNLLTLIDLSQNTALTYLDCDRNQLTSLDVSKNTALITLDCPGNQINETEMGNLVESLPANNGEFYVKYLNNANDQNVITTVQVAVAKAKGWKVYAVDENWNLVEYDGDEQTMEPIETADFGNDIDADTNLDGNVVGDVFYSISSGDGSYDPAEGCIVVTKPTDDSAIDGKDIFGEDFKAGYTGVVFKVAPGKGSVKVEAQTEGNMVLKVKIGDNDPIEMELEGRLKVSFPYNVSEETLVYIYGGTNATGAKGIRKAASTGALKIYGIEVTSGTDGIKDIKNERLKMKDSSVYNLNGQRVISSPSGRPGGVPTKGVYIINGKKVVVK